MKVTINYDVVYKEAGPIQDLGFQMKNEVNAIYTTVNSMVSVWHGIRYNQLVDIFNSQQVVTPLMECLRFCISILPYEMRKAAKNYSMADFGTISYNEEESIGAFPVAIRGTQEDVFIDTSAVEEKRIEMRTHFNRFMEYINTIQARVNGLPWESESADNFRSTIANIKNQMINVTSELDRQIGNLINTAIQDFTQAETKSNAN